MEPKENVFSVHGNPLQENVGNISCAPLPPVETASRIGSTDNLPS